MLSMIDWIVPSWTSRKFAVRPSKAGSITLSKSPAARYTSGAAEICLSSVITPERLMDSSENFNYLTSIGPEPDLRDCILVIVLFPVSKSSSIKGDFSVIDILRAPNSSAFCSKTA